MPARKKLRILYEQHSWRGARESYIRPQNLAQDDWEQVGAALVEVLEAQAAREKVALPVDCRA